MGFFVVVVFKSLIIMRPLQYASLPPLHFFFLKKGGEEVMAME